MDLLGGEEPYLGELSGGGSAGTESGIAGVFELFRRKGVNDQEIITEIFKRDINADVQEIQKIAGLYSMVVGRLKGNVTKTRKKRRRERLKHGKRARETSS